MSSNKAKPSSKQRPKQSKSHKFEEYWSPDDVKIGLQSGRLISGPIRVNPKNFEESFILHPKGDADVFIDGLAARNRALNDDEVAIVIEPIGKWKVVQSDDQLSENGDKKWTRLSVAAATKGDPTAVAALFPGAEAPMDLESNVDPPGCSELFETVTRTGRVVAILREMHHRTAVGIVRPMAPPENNPKKRLLFHPHDRRVPRMILDQNDYPPNVFARTEEYTSSYFIARLTDWNIDSIYARGRIVRLLGEMGDLAVERECLLTTHGITENDFSEAVITSLPPATDDLDPAEVARRRDFRNDCVFTIDPATARDLDDALHVREIERGRFEVGVHIADVSHYVPEYSPVDEEARKRATTVYLIDQVIPMLPRRLCEELCSLNPRESKFAFSVVWQMDDQGNVLDTWFGRSVIRSCVKLSYNHAQRFLVERERNEWSDEEFPEVIAPWTLPDVVRSVRQLGNITAEMRARRFASGALLLNTPKLGFKFESGSTLPCGVHREVLQESNFLVEELMLLANISVSERIFDSYPNEAFLRRHPPPSQRALKEVQHVFQALGMAVDTESAAAIQGSLQATVASVGVDKTEVLVNLLSKPMQLARYFCAGQLARCNQETGMTFTHHYALNVKLYTHFTSPIRRYADIIVHRQLFASLNGQETSIVNINDSSQRGYSLDAVANHCNWRKKNAKLAGEASRDLFLGAFISMVKSFEDNGIVLGVLDRSFDVILLNLGIIKRVYCEQIENLGNMEFKPFTNVKGAGSITLQYTNGATQVIRPMSEVKLMLKTQEKKNPLKFDVLLVPPRGAQATG